MKHQIYSSIGFLIEAEGVLSVLMQTAYSYADAEQFRNKSAFVIYFSMYQDWKRKSLCQTAVQVYLTNRQWFGVVCTVIDSDIHHHSGQTVVDHEAQPTGIVDFIFYHDIDVK